MLRYFAGVENFDRLVRFGDKSHVRGSPTAQSPDIQTMYVCSQFNVKPSSQDISVWTIVVGEQANTTI